MSAPSKAPKPKRQTKTPRQRAEDALGVAQRRVEKLECEETRLVDELDAARRSLAEARARRDYVAADPALADDAQMSLDDVAGGDDA